MTGESLHVTNPFSALRYPAFARFALGSTFCGVAQFLAGLATPFLINQLTDSQLVGRCGLVRRSSPGGHRDTVRRALADQMDRRLLLLAGIGLQSLVMVAIVVLYTPDRLTPWLILGLNFVGGSASSFLWAPTQSLAAVLVPRESLAAAVRMVSITFTVSRSVGPGVAALTLAFGGPGLAFSMALGIYLVGFSVMTTVRTGWSPTGGGGSLPGTIERRDCLRSGPTRDAAGLSAGLHCGFARCSVRVLADRRGGRRPVGLGGGGLGVLATSAGVGSMLASAYISGPGSRVARSIMERRNILFYGFGPVVVASTSWMALGILGYLCMGAAHMLHGTTLVRPYRSGLTTHIGVGSCRFFWWLS
ncbi:MAG: hypothetical protein Ct9H300mP12_06040 [Acidimicrobiales bacterium]|nr:MAG: hypothetical protein Ct9H300mP12_06040 [Acidimicrobiales bacterium]